MVRRPMESVLALPGLGPPPAEPVARATDPDGALRELFGFEGFRRGQAEAVQAALESHPRVTILREEIADPPADWDNVIVATGPLTSQALAQNVCALTGEDSLAFFDAIAPIVERDSINMDIAWFQSRYDKKGPGGGDADYINCPLNEEQYRGFVAALTVCRRPVLSPCVSQGMRARWLSLTL